MFAHVSINLAVSLLVGKGIRGWPAEMMPGSAQNINTLLNQLHAVEDDSIVPENSVIRGFIGGYL